LPFSFSVERRIIAFSVALCLRLQVLLHLQLVYLAEELLEQLATFRAEALLEPIHYFIGRKAPIERSSLTHFPPDHLRQRHHTAEVRLRVFLG